MSKIQLKNVSNMNQGIPSGPLDGRLNMREAGALNESGMLDDSGLIDDSGQWEVNSGYEYHTVIIDDSIYVRYLITWTDSKPAGGNLAQGKIELDMPGVNTEATGDLGDPIINTNQEYYEFVRQQVNTYSVMNRTIDASATIDYIKYPLGKGHVDDPGGAPVTKYKSEIITYTVPEP